MNYATELSEPDPVEAPVGEQEFAPAKLAWIAVWVAALGYFVDVFDMWLFSNFRIPSLAALGLSGAALTDTGAYLINCQQGGLLLGGFVWGIMGDKRGRVSVMFGSILLYSSATFLCAFVTSVPQYAALRFIAGFGLAGEIGAGITLVSELLPKNKRGYGTTLVASLGVAGAIAAAAAGKYLHWQNAYIIGGVMGFLLLGLRIAVYESGIFSAMARNKEVVRGSLKLLLSSRSRMGRYLCCVLVGVPIYFVFGLIMTFAPEIAQALNISGSVSVPDVMLYGSIGMTLGDVGAGVSSQLIKSRKIPIAILLVLGAIATLFLFKGGIETAAGYCLIAGGLGLCAGYWACLLTTTAEQFGTNLRATVATTVPNVVRASAILLNMVFVPLKTVTDPAHATLWIGIGVFALAFVGLFGLKETYGKNLNFVER